MFYLDFFGFLSSALACRTMSSLLPGAGAGLAFTLGVMAFGGMALAGLALAGLTLVGMALENVALGNDLKQKAIVPCECWSQCFCHLAIQSRSNVIVLLIAFNACSHDLPLVTPVCRKRVRRNQWRKLLGH